MIKMKLRICTIILPLSISLISCINVKRKNEKMVNIEAENHYDTTFQKKHIVKNKLLKDTLKTEDVISFYKKFMQSYILGGSLNRRDRLAMSCLTTEFIQKLEKLYLEEYDCENGGCLAEWVFVTGGNDANLEVDIQNMKMIPLGGNWYKIMFGKQQKNSYKVKIIKQRNKYKICDIINNNTI